MRKSLTKVMATAGALSLLASAIPFTGVSADDTADFNFEVKNGGVVITEWNDITATEATVPATVTVDGEELDVIGIADYAFGLCEDLAVINVPDSLTIDAMENMSFMTSAMVMNYLDAELADTSSTDEIIKYIATKADYKDGNWTDKDLAELTVKLNNHLNKVDISVASTVEGKVITLMKNIDDMGFSQKNLDKFAIWETGIPYTGLTLKGKTGTEIEEYANAKNIDFEAAESYILGDADGDGKFNVRDCSWLARQIANGNVEGNKVNGVVNEAADYDKSGSINVRDVSSMARALVTASAN